MDNPVANQLPDVDALPDGFVESPPESVAPVTPSIEIDIKKNKALTPDSSNDSSYEGKAEKVPKVRTFPVPLSDKDDVIDNGHMELREDTSATKSESSTSAAGGPDSKTTITNEKDKGQNNTAPQSSRGSDSINTNEAQSENIKNRKAPGAPRSPRIIETNRKAHVESVNFLLETLEGKRKTSKRTLKTEQEFLEFTFKYKQVLAERDAAIVVRDKLESLCRELQRQNKMLMDEFKRVSEEGHNLRSDLSTKFEDAIKDVSIRLEEQKVECLSQLKENEMLRDKLKQLADEYTLSQQKYAQELKQKTLELKIAELKVQQNEERLAHEQAQIKVYADKISQHLETEKSLRQQLTADGEKFQQFQDALLKSNEVFETFKQEIEKMSKLTKELKKENTFLKSKCEKSDYTLVELIEERERMKKQLEKTKNQKEKLESLCRSLQAERKQGFNSSSQPEPDSAQL
ncbi:uncharacterized protein LOC130798010 isoform X1 [Amaranthus tricolor]|uniref:uncharacterized protein LOC130798010 isoform X1 n=1 Tax=Amaranthus tricolor TaxID=29722 RepID=UPI00258E26D6|nr:uncharacterized protein LOC130798010 isoform X1 [Amaranthus tricolor]XP_057516811.1 uncharacterized protein LOC130798010 isoform X1 [Amaranthus tricolor]